VFRVDLHDVTYLRYDDANGDQYLVRWPQMREVVRRGTSATTLGPPEPGHDVLAPAARFFARACGQAMVATTPAVLSRSAIVKSSLLP